MGVAAPGVEAAVEVVAVVSSRKSATTSAVATGVVVSSSSMLTTTKIATGTTSATTMPAMSHRGIRRTPAPLATGSPFTRPGSAQPCCRGSCG